MGIKDLFKSIKSLDESLISDTDFAQFCDQLIAVDASCYIHKYIHVRPEKREWLITFSNLVFAFRRANIHPVFVFDGSTPETKKAEVDKRRQEREKTEDRFLNLRADLEEFEATGHATENLRNENRSLTNENRIDTNKIQEAIYKLHQRCRKVDSTDLKLSKELLDVCNIPWIQSPDGIESEWICAELCRNKSVVAVLSEDSDLLAHRCPTLISNPKMNGPIWSCTSITYSEVINSFDLSEEQFLDYCILCGTDYNSRIPRVGPQTAIKLINKHGSIEKIASETQHQIEPLKTEVTRSMFKIHVKAPSVTYSGLPEQDSLRRFCSRYQIPCSEEIFNTVFRRTLRIDNGDGTSEVVSPKADRILESREDRLLRVRHSPI